MDEVYLNRAHQADLEIRGDGRTVVGIAVPFDAPTPIRDASGSYTELFRRGAFAKTISERGDRVKFLAQHDRRAMPLGRATLLREDAAGLYAEFRVSQTRDGDDALALIRDGALDALSIGFRPVKDVWNRDRSMVERTEARLDEVSAVSFPAYDGALIAGVRTAVTDLSDLIAALIDDPEALALLARSLPVLGSSAPDAADPGTSETGPAAPDLEPLTHSGLSADARSRVLALLS
ncbi:MAG: HK97 family phage prohead protease [bacterium]|mgnify:FL=1|nr:HK97 family phage prohead protease [bacterium]